MLGLVSRPAELDAAALVQRRAHRDRKSALRPRRAAPFRHRHAVRDDDQPAHRTESQPRDSNPAQWMMPTSEQVCGHLPQRWQLAKSKSYESKLSGRTWSREEGVHKGSSRGEPDR